MKSSSLCMVKSSVCLPALLWMRRTLQSNSTSKDIGRRTDDLLFKDFPIFSNTAHGTITLDCRRHHFPHHNMLQTLRNSTLYLPLTGKGASCLWGGSYALEERQCDRKLGEKHQGLERSQENQDLGQSEEKHYCSSVLKKRRKKINKHKYKKWRKKMLFKRRALKR